MQVRVLGQIEAGDDRRSYPLGGPMQRRVFAALVARRGEMVGVSELVDVSWPDGNVSDGAEHNVRTYVHRLRTALRDGGDRIETVGTGYRLSLGPDEIDVDRFEELATRAARSLGTGDAVAVLDAIAEAEDLWHGRPFGEFADEPWAEADVARLTELRLSMHEHRAEALLIAGRASDAVVALEWLVREEPYRERPRALLMRALYESGRQADALRAYQDFRRLLIDDVGVEPSRELVELDRDIAVGELESAPGRTRTVGNYELHERIGEGAFAIVHRATQTSLGREVAVKIVRADLANRPEFIRRFEAEAQMVAAIEHPNVVPLYDYWREPGQAFLVMRWMTGGSLESRLDQGRWPLDRTLDVIDQIAAGLDAAHAHGVVHRDVKPANILFDDAGRAYLGDFGIALTSAELATPQAALSEGSPVFASPEQLRREPAGPEADVHALAIVAFAMLTGRTPFAESPDEATLLRRQLDEPIPPVSSRRHELPTSLDGVIATAASKRPSDRYPTASGFAIALRSAASGGVTVSPSVGAVARRNPYKGLRAFDETDAVDFHGRQRLVDELITHLRTSDGRFLAVVGPSGSGKSSVVRAGLIPALREGRVPGSSDWFTTTMIPGTHPFEALETALLRVAVNPPNALIDQLRDGDRGILRGVKRILPDDRAVIAVVIDQVEELFNGGVEPDERDRFLGALATAVEASGSPLRLVITLRADFYGGPLRDPRFAPLLRRNTIAVGPLAPDELEEAVTGPSRSVGVAIEPGLIAELIADVNSQPGTLPLLQYALTQVFDHDDGDVLTVDAYRSIGGLSGALGRRAEELWRAADGAERLAARRLFGRLVTLGEGTEDTRRRARISELGDDAVTRAVVDRFGAARLLTFDHDPATREPTVEVAHEALIREWSRLRAWLDDDRDSLRLHRHLTNAASAWVDRDRDPNELYRGARLDAGESLLTGDTVTLNEIESEFLQASLERRRADDAAARRGVRRMRRLVTATAIVAAVALLAGAVALVQWRRADDKAAEAAASEDLAEERATEAEQARARGDLERIRAVARSTAGQSPTIAALLAVESHRIEPSTDSLDVLHRVMTEIPGYRGSVPAGPYLAAELLDDGVTLVAVGAETIDVWDLRRRELTTSIDHASPTGAAVVRAIDDDRVAVLGDRRDETNVYDLASGTEVTRIAHAAIVNDISVSPDGERGAFAMEGGAVEVWNLGNDELAATLDTGDIDVYFARWSPDDGLLAVVTLQSEVQLWDVDEQARVWSTGPSEAAIVNQVRPFAATFTPDGSRYVVLSGSLGGGLRILDSSDGSDVVPPMPAPGLRGFALGDIYWIDDATVAIPSDGNVMAFPLDTPAAGRTIIDRFVSEGNSVVYSAAIDQHIVAGLSGLEFWSADGSGPLERAIPAPPEQLAALEAGGVTILASLAPDGTRLIMSTLHIPVNPPATSFDLTQDPPVATTLDPMITMGFGEFTLVGLPSFVWQVLDVDLRPLGAPVPLPFDYSEVGVSEDGRYVAIGRLGGMADIYTGSGELVGTVELGGPAEFAGAQVLPTFTSDGEFLALGTTDGRSGLWATEGLERIDRPDVHENSWTFALGPWLFVAGGGDTFQRIDPTTMEPVGGAVGLNGLDSPGYAKVDPTHARLAATGSDVVKVFDLDAERQLGRDLAFRGGAGRAQFSADGAILAVPTTAGITLWNFDTDSWPDIACQMAGRNLTQEEWREFGPRTIEYRATCPRYPIES